MPSSHYYLESARPTQHAQQQHRVIIPVFIPEVSGYFAHALKITQLCLDSLRATAAGRISVTLISNGCCRAARELLEEYFAQGWIETLELNEQNHGKVEAIVSAARGTHERLITFADSDVLFRPGWLEAVEQVFHDFPECGVAGPAPLPSLSWAYTASTVVAAWLRGELALERVVDPVDLDRFAASINNPTMFKPIHREKQLVVRRGTSLACVGCGHFICTLRHEVLTNMPEQRCEVACGGWAVSEWIDTPPDAMGFWRLATPQTYALHMGNTPEPWMDEVLEADCAALLGTARGPLNSIPAPRRHWTAALPNAVRQRGLTLVRKMPTFRDYR
jgi:hypothetical protein